jgi:hypothetical protein
MNHGHEKAPIPIEHKRNFLLETNADIMEKDIQVLPGGSADQVLLVSPRRETRTWSAIQSSIRFVS